MQLGYSLKCIRDMFQIVDESPIVEIDVPEKSKSKSIILDRDEKGRILSKKNVRVGVDSPQINPPKNIMDNPYIKNYFAFRECDSKDKVRKSFSDKKEQYLQYLGDVGGYITLAAKKMGFNHVSVNYAMKNDALFEQAVRAIKDYHQEERLDALEELSINQAKKPGCTTERIFQLKALNPHKYRDRSPQQATQINLIVSGTNPKDRLNIISKLAKQ